MRARLSALLLLLLLLIGVFAASALFSEEADIEEEERARQESQRHQQEGARRALSSSWNASFLLTGRAWLLQVAGLQLRSLAPERMGWRGSFEVREARGRGCRARDVSIVALFRGSTAEAFVAKAHEEACAWTVAYELAGVGEYELEVRLQNWMGLAPYEDPQLQRGLLPLAGNSKLLALETRGHDPNACFHACVRSPSCSGYHVAERACQLYTGAFHYRLDANASGGGNAVSLSLQERLARPVHLGRYSFMGLAFPPGEPLDLIHGRQRVVVTRLGGVPQRSSQLPQCRTILPSHAVWRERDGQLYAEPPQCQYRPVGPSELRRCFHTLGVDEAVFYGDSVVAMLAAEMKGHYFHDVSNLTFSLRPSRGKRSFCVFNGRVVYTLWHGASSMEALEREWLRKPLSTLRSMERHCTYGFVLLNPAYVSSEREPHVTLDRAAAFNAVMRKHAPRNWTVVPYANWTLPVMPYHSSDNDGMHASPPLLRALIGAMANTLCHF